MEDINADTVYTWLEEVKDPEIPVLSLVDLGVIMRVETENGKVRIEMTPTFTGCPALETMQDDIRKLLYSKGISEVEIEVTYRIPWTSDRITEKGREALKKFGFAPPPAQSLFEDISILEHATCPRCNGNDTELRNPFGPTLCRSIHYCNTCQEAFEQFKPV